mmetsp:Transcript_12684/g.22597  ORF Transcript_12684/g.22597 Transcript_12684/m.22597 type:complete len:856 (-) Transcript_12684:64-2631(-)
MWGKRKAEVKELAKSMERASKLSRHDSSENKPNCSSKIEEVWTAVDGPATLYLPSTEAKWQEATVLPLPTQLSPPRIEDRRPRTDSEFRLLTLEDLNTGIQNFESVVRSEPALLRLICTFLGLGDITALTCTSKVMLQALRDAELNLNLFGRPFSCKEINHWFGRDELQSKQALTSWRLTSVFVSLEKGEQDALFSVLHLPSLRQLILAGNVDAFDASPLQHCKNLEVFDTGVSCASLTGMDRLKEIDQLRFVYLRNAPDIVDVSFLSGQKYLEEVSLFMCSNLKSLHGLENCKSLKVLDCGGCSSLRDLAPITKCVALEQASFAECHQLKAIAPLAEGHLSRLHFLNLTGCRNVEDLAALQNLAKLQRLLLQRTSLMQALDLFSASSQVIWESAKSVFETSSLFDVWEVVPHLLENLVSPQRSQSLILRTLQIIELVANHGGGGISLLNEGRVSPFLLDIVSKEGTPIKLRTSALSSLVRICQLKDSILTLDSLNVAENVLKVLSYLLGEQRERIETEEDQSTDLKHDLAISIEHCASIVLFLAADEATRCSIVSVYPRCIELLVSVIQEGTSCAKAEAAGALWNFSATLSIGVLIADTPGAIPSLISLLSSEGTSARLQATGAIRNLAIVSENKSKLIDHGVMDSLARVCSSRAAAVAPENQNADTANLALTPPQTLPLNVDDWGVNHQNGDSNMISPQSDSLLILKAIAIVRILASDQRVHRQICGNSMLPAILTIVAKDNNTQIVRQGCGVLLAISCHASGRGELLIAGAVPALLQAIENKTQSTSAIVSCLGALWYLASGPRTWPQALRSTAIRPLLKLLHHEDAEVQSRAAGTLRCLSEQVIKFPLNDT